MHSADQAGMTATPDRDFASNRDFEGPRWLGSVARRGLAQQHGVGWTEEEVDGEDARPIWLGSVARREGTRSDDSGWVDPEEAERPKWLGSVARRGDSARSLVLIDMEPEPDEQVPEETAATAQETVTPIAPAGSSPPLKEILKPSQAAGEAEECREPKGIAGDLGMHLRVA